MASVESKVILDERRDEEIAVVVAVPEAQIERHTRPPACILQQLRLQLALDEGILRTLIDEYRRPGPAARFECL